MSLKRNQPLLVCFGIIVFGLLFAVLKEQALEVSEDVSTSKVRKRDFLVDVRTIGELEASQSLSISSQIRSDNGKIIYIIPDGTNVQVGDVLVKLDPTPFEEKLELLKAKLKEQQGYVATLEKGLQWEISQAEKDEKTSIFEIEGAELELNKILQGDGPLECARLKGAMNKALAKLEELQAYASDLEDLQKEGFLNPIEINNANKKLEDEQESYMAAKLQYESYINHVYPMQVKKAEAAVKQARMKQEENRKIRGHAIGKAKVEVDQALQNVELIKQQCQEAERDLVLTEIKAKSPGMVVHREDYRSGQRRKPRIGDVLVRNQIILDLPDLNQMTVKSKVREVDLSHVDVGKKASIEIDAYPQLQLSGTVSSIGVLALADHGKPTEEKYFDIRIQLDKSDSRVRPGMTTRVVLHSADVQDVLAIPIHSIYYEKNKAYCYVGEPKSYKKREVVAGISNEEWIEIKSGLKEGESVCLAPPS